MTHSEEKGQRYLSQLEVLEAVLEGESDAVLRMASFVAHLFQSFEVISWCGFYRRRGDELLVGPYQGKLACLRIAWGRGVCGTVAASGESLVVEDVHEFPGHIACDPESKSEIVVPVCDPEGRVEGVLDLDSTEAAAFDEVDREMLELWVARIFPDGAIGILR